MMARRVTYENVKNIFDCLENDRPFKEDLKVQIILQDCGHKFSPPPLQFPDGYFLLLQNTYANKKEKTEAATQNPEDYINDPRIPSQLKASILVENLPAQVWSVSGPQFNDLKEYPNIQQRYCYPRGQSEYCKCKGASIYTIATGIKKEDARYRLLHVYYSETRAASNRNRGRVRPQGKPKVQRSVNNRKGKPASHYLLEEEHTQNRHDACLDVDPDSYFQRSDENDTICKPPVQTDLGTMEASNSINDACTNIEFSFSKEALVKLEASPIDCTFLPTGLLTIQQDDMTLLDLTCNSWDATDDESIQDSVPSDPDEIWQESPGIEDSKKEDSDPKRENKNKFSEVSPVQEANIHCENALLGTNERSFVDEQRPMIGSAPTNLKHDSSQIACNNASDTNNENRRFLDRVSKTIETTEVAIYNALCKVDKSELDRCVSLVAVWARERAQMTFVSMNRKGIECQNSLLEGK